MAKAKQQFLEGMDPPSIKEIDDAADAYVDVRDKRMKMQVKEAEKKEELHALMKSNKLETYEYEGKVVTIEGVENIKVSKKKEKPAPAQE